MSSRPSPPHRALVVGAGFVGGAIVRELVRRHWDVRALVRTPVAALRVETWGATPVVGDVLAPGALAPAVRGCEVVFHVAAANSAPLDDPGRPERVRVEGCRNIFRAARESGVRRVVVGSGYWVYADQPGTITEESPLDPRGESRVNRATEAVALDPAVRGPVEALVVRPGMVYGDGSWFRPVMEGILAGTYRCIDGGTNPWSFVSLDDTGSGFRVVAESGAPGEVYNLVDGHPEPWAAFAGYVADRLGRARPASVTFAEAVSEYGPDVAHHLRARRAVSAAKISGLGWKPFYPNVRAGLEPLLGPIADDGRRTTR